MSELTPEQQEVFNHQEGPALVLASAGSGKSHTVLARTARLIEEGIDPAKILLTTFSKKAAEDLKEKAATRFPGSDIEPRTIHSLGYSIIREEYPAIPGVRKGVQPVKSQKALAKRILAAPSDKFNPYGMDWEGSDVQHCLSVVSELKRRQILPAEAYEFLKEEKYFCAGKLATFYKIYQNQLKYANQIDFDDMLLLPCLLFEAHPEIARRWKKFDFIMVDEAQDSNLIQYGLVKHVMNDERNVMWIGDDFQSIYSFMGSTPDKTVYEFDQNFPGGSVYLMQNNFRCSANIVNLANGLIDNMFNPYKKGAIAMRHAGSEITANRHNDPSDEAFAILENMKNEYFQGEISEDSHEFNKTAVLYRTNKQSRMIEDQLIRAKIPYIIYGGASFYSRKEVKDLIAFVQVAHAPNKYDEALKRIINIPTKSYGKPTRYIGRKFIESKEFAAERSGSFFKACTETRLTWGQQKAMDDLQQMVLKIRKQETVTDMMQWAIDNAYETYLHKEYGELDQEGESRMDTLTELMSAASEFGSDVNAFLKHVEEIQEEERNKQDQQDFNGVNLLTVHRSKGLEWDNVYLVGVSEGLMPFYFNGPGKTEDEPTAVVNYEEERRICYVGVTRAKDNLHISCVDNGYKNEPLGPSDFLNEMGIDLSKDSASAGQNEGEFYTEASNETFFEAVMGKK